MELVWFDVYTRRGWVVRYVASKATDGFEISDVFLVSPSRIEHKRMQLDEMGQGVFRVEDEDIKRVME